MEMLEKPRNEPQVWLVTGCSTGFGRHYIDAILARGDKAIATARRLELIDDFSQRGIPVMQLDVDAAPSAIGAKIDRAIEIYGHVDVLVNNAGYGQLGTVEDTLHESLVAQFQTNVFGPLNLTRAILPHFRERGRGTVVVMSSVGQMVNAPGAGAYMASKAAVDSMFGTLALELQTSPIRILILQPGSYRTDLVDPGKVALTTPPSEPYQGFIEGFTKQMNAAHMNQPGDPVKLTKLVVDMVHDGKYKGKLLPTKLLLGSDAVAIAHSIQTENLRTLGEWKSVSESTDFEG